MNDCNFDILKENIRKRMSDKHMTQNDVAKALDTTQANIAKHLKKGDDGAPRKVWVFPLRKMGAAPSTQPKSSSNATLVESTLTVGQTVFHFMYREGEIRSFTDTKIYIQFEIGLRIFPYPAAIQKRYLTA